MPAAGFYRIRQRVRVVADHQKLERLAEERERLTAAGQRLPADDNYAPYRSVAENPVVGEQNGIEILDWEEAAREDRQRVVALLGDPGFGKTWLLRYEARRLGLAALDTLDTAWLSELTVPFLFKLPDLADEAGGAINLQEVLQRALAAKWSESFQEHCLRQLASGQVALLRCAEPVATAQD